MGFFAWFMVKKMKKEKNGIIPFFQYFNILRLLQRDSNPQTLVCKRTLSC